MRVKANGGGGGGFKDYAMVHGAMASQHGGYVGTTDNSDLYTVPSQADVDNVSSAVTVSITVKEAGNYHYIALYAPRGVNQSTALSVAGVNVPLNGSWISEDDVALSANDTIQMSIAASGLYTGNMSIFVIKK